MWVLSKSQAGDKGQDKVTAKPGGPPLLPSPSLPPPCEDSLGILALFIEHHNLVHTEDGAGSGNLASQVGAKLR